jgi:hypothetical protein
MKSQGGIFKEVRKELEKKKPQIWQVLDYLRTGKSLTHLIAMSEIGTIAVHYHVWALRHIHGYNIITTMKEAYNGNKYASYKLGTPEKIPTTLMVVNPEVVA